MGARILICLDNSNYSKRAVSFGINLAKKSGASLAGIAIIDTFSIERHAAGAGPGSFYYAEKLVNEKINDAKIKLESLLQNFQDLCKQSGIPCETILKTGTPAKEILKETEMADLALIGIKTFFHFEFSSQSDDTFEKVISHSKCPIFAVIDEEIPMEMDTLIAYDGNAKANNAIRAFSCFNDRFKVSSNVTVLTVSDDPEEGNTISQKATDYLNTHNVHASKKVLCGRPREVIYKTAKECEGQCKTLLVTGTNGNNELSDYILGNSIKHIIEDGSVPLFIFH